MDYAKKHAKAIAKAEALEKRIRALTDKLHETLDPVAEDDHDPGRPSKSGRPPSED